jgi:hypothetical protein
MLSSQICPLKWRGISKNKRPISFFIFPPFLPSNYHGKKIKIKNYADSLFRVMPPTRVMHKEQGVLKISAPPP